MELLKSRKGALTFLLLVLLFVSCYWIVKSEIRAASLQSQLEEHHKQLKGNSDVLDGLVTFFRGTKNGSFTATENLASMIADLASITLKDDKVEIETPGDIEIGNGNDKRFGYNKEKDYFYMVHGETILNFGKHVNADGKLDYGAFIQTESGGNTNTFHISDKGVGIWVHSDEGEYSLKLASKKKFVELKKGNSKVRFEGDDISIEANGDINITSKNGKVNINGKR